VITEEYEQEELERQVQLNAMIRDTSLNPLKDYIDETLEPMIDSEILKDAVFNSIKFEELKKWLVQWANDYACHFCCRYHKEDVCEVCYIEDTA
jgi:hypothetical protein